MIHDYPYLYKFITRVYYEAFEDIKFELYEKKKRMTQIGKEEILNLIEYDKFKSSSDVKALINIILCIAEDCSKNTGKLTVVERWSLKCSKFIFSCYPCETLIRQSANACGNKDSVKKYVKDCFEKIDKGTFIDIMMELTGCLHEDAEFMFRQPVLLLCGSDDKLGNIKKLQSHGPEAIAIVRCI